MWEDEARRLILPSEAGEGDRPKGGGGGARRLLRRSRGRLLVNVFGHAISMPQLYGQLLIGLINGSFHALLSLGLAVIFGMLDIVNFAHGAFYMMGAFAA